MQYNHQPLPGRVVRHLAQQVHHVRYREDVQDPALRDVPAGSIEMYMRGTVAEESLTASEAISGRRAHAWPEFADTHVASRNMLRGEGKAGRV